MAHRNHLVSPRVLLTAAVGMAVVCFSRHLRADPPASTQPALTVLQELSNDTQRLYLQSRHSMVSVQLPTPQMVEQKEFLQKWGSVMDPAVRAKIIEEQERASGALHGAPTLVP